MLYGALIWVIGQGLVLGRAFLVAARRADTVGWPAVLVGSLFLVFVSAVLLLAQYGLVHLLGRFLFGARGTYVRVLRPLLLGSIVTWLAVVPYVGGLAAGLWSVAVMMVVFENVDEIERLQAFGLSFVIGVAFSVLILFVVGPR
jgi:hypothetical protein